MNLAGIIDHTLLKPDANDGHIGHLVDEAIRYQFAAVCVNGLYVAAIAKALGGTKIKACGVVDFPLGANRPAVKASQAAIVVEDGAQEIDFVAHLPHLLACDTAAAAAEFIQIVRAVRAVNPNVVIKVIIESALLLQDKDLGESRIASACRAAQESGCDFVKTSTGFHLAGGASGQAVRLIKQHAGHLRIKASGGIRGYDDAIELVKAGADRLGCTASATIVGAEHSAA